MDSSVQPIEHAIEAIEAFVVSTVNDRAAIAPDRFRELSFAIELAKSARDRRLRPHPDPAMFVELCNRYRQSLERLRRRLSEIEIILISERSRLFEEHSRNSRIREWHNLFSRTQ